MYGRISYDLPTEGSSAQGVNLIIFFIKFDSLLALLCLNDFLPLLYLSVRAFSFLPLVNLAKANCYPFSVIMTRQVSRQTKRKGRERRCIEDNLLEGVAASS